MSPHTPLGNEHEGPLALAASQYQTPQPMPMRTRAPLHRWRQCRRPAVSNSMGFEYFLRHSDPSARIQPGSPLDPCPMFWLPLEGEQGTGTGCVKGNKQNDGDSVILLIHPCGAQSHFRGSSATFSHAHKSLAPARISVPQAPGYGPI